MPVLYLTRHAKSSKDDPSLRDFDRPLNERGIHDAETMAKAFTQRGERLDRLISSPAVRAYTTASYFAVALGIARERIELERDIYEADVTTLLKVTRGIGGDPRSVMLFGHNPGSSLFAAWLIGKPPAELPTCTTVRIDLDVNGWRDVDRGTGRLIWIDFPRNHR